MTDPRLSWPTLAERTPKPGAHCDWFDARYGCAGSGAWYTQSDQFVISGFEDAYGVMVSNHATTHWRLAQGNAEHSLLTEPSGSLPSSLSQL